MTTRSIAVAEHELALLDTSCVIARPEQLAALTNRAVVSTITVAELAYGLHQDDPIVAAAREARYRLLLTEFEPLPYTTGAANLYGAIAAAVRNSGATRSRGGSI
jgi:predicted nucleic acid-binding protein